MPKIKAHTIITGHVNADFDCLAGIVAAGKLYPEAVLVFPGSQEKTLRHFFIQSATYMLSFAAPKDIDYSAVKKLVVVDTRQRARLQHVEQAFDNPDLEIHIYDHHQSSDDDLSATKSLIRPWGATASILTKEIMDRKLELTPDEATLIGLGIYEDTGSFTFHSTTTHDFEAAAWLLTQGMSMDTVSDLLTRDLTASQVALLNTLLENATTHDIHGIEVVFAEASSEEYIGDFALLAHKMMEMENLRVLFALCRMQDRITLVARSRSSEVDAGRVCESFGGGGHPYAASASVKDRTMTQIKDELFALLYSEINPQLHVGAFMSKPPITIEKDKTLGEATEIMTRYGLKAIPVLTPETREVVGLLDHQIADKAVGHGLREVLIKEYMAREIQTVEPESDLYVAMEIILGQNQRLVPVIVDGKITGVFTRTDLINILIDEPARIPETLLPERKRERNIKMLMRERLPQDIFDLLFQAGKLADKHGFEIYVVGGFVRDILLNRPNLDVDLVVEGDGIAFAKILADALEGRVKSHSKFRTAVVILPDGQRIDVATARLEYYESPAALPTVQLSSIKMDLYRRDFTINALAVHLNPENFGKLVDFFGAQHDLRDRTIRVLHSLSFVEDPTRILRAIRFEQRFNFKIGGQTERLIKNAVQMHFYQKLSGSRVFNELKLVFKEKNVRQCLARMQELKLLAPIHAGLALDTKTMDLLDKIEEVLDWYRLLYISPAPSPWKIYLLGLCANFEVEDLDALCQRLNFSKRDQRELVSLTQSVSQGFANVAKWKSVGGPMSRLHSTLRDIPLEGTLFLLARSKNEDVRKAISTYLTRLRDISLDITGADLKKLGLPPGPQYANILNKVLAAKIDGKISGKDEQLALARRLMKNLPNPAPKFRKER